MHNLRLATCALAAVAVSFFGIAGTAQAGPMAGAKKAITPEAGSGLLIKTGSRYYYRERRVTVREYAPGYDYYDDDYYDRPYGYVYSKRRYYHDDDYYYDGYVRRRGGIRVRAPFVDIYIP